MKEPGILLNNISKEFISRDGKSVNALEGVTFELNKASITSIVGPTGSGKSTILRIIAGLEQPDFGDVKVNGNQPKIMSGNTGFLTQHHTLLPWMAVSENIALPMKIKGIAHSLTIKKTQEILELMGLEDSGNLYPHELSGGMIQRAAMGRLLAGDSSLWLMDEPFSSLDDLSRHRLQELLLTLRDKHGNTVVFVTHSIDESVYLADRIVIISTGPGKVIETMDVSLPRPRDRMSPEYGQVMEAVRMSIESALMFDV